MTQKPTWSLYNIATSSITMQATIINKKLLCKCLLNNIDNVTYKHNVEYVLSLTNWTYSNGFTNELYFSSFIRFVEMWWLLISFTLEIPWSEYLNQKYKYQSLQNHICLKLPVFVVICLKNLDNFTKTCMILTQTWAIGLLINIFTHCETCKLQWIFTLFLKNLVYKSYS